MFPPSSLASPPGGWPESVSNCARPTRGVRDRALREQRRLIRPPSLFLWNFSLPSWNFSPIPSPPNNHQSHHLYMPNSLFLINIFCIELFIFEPGTFPADIPLYNGSAPLHPFDRRQPWRVRTLSPGTGPNRSRCRPLYRARRGCCAPLLQDRVSYNPNISFQYASGDRSTSRARPSPPF